MKKERHGFLTSWLNYFRNFCIFVVIVSGIALANPKLAFAMETVTGRNFTDKGLSLYMFIFAITSGLGSILLLSWKLSGFILLSLPFVIIALLSFLSPSSLSGIALLVIPAATFALLQLKKNGISAWSHLTGGKKGVVEDAASVPGSQNRDDLKKCPFCAEDIKKEAIVCRFCGRDIP